MSDHQYQLSGMSYMQLLQEQYMSVSRNLIYGTTEDSDRDQEVEKLKFLIEIMQVQGRDRSHVKYIAEQLGLEGSYVPQTYIEQIQLEKLVNDVIALPDDLKTKLSIDDNIASSPKEALLRASADRRIKYLNRNNIQLLS